jgi:Tfp pilus assembly protein PilN
MFRRRHRIATRTVAIEICRSTLQLAICEAGDGTSRRARVQTIPWRRESTSLHSESGSAELTAALKQLAAEHRLQGHSVYVSLNGDFCVTRAVTGTTERVRHELAQLEQRSALYLSLGHGKKALGGSVRHIDARHQHALLTVVNRKTLATLVEAANRSGIELKRVEPSLVSLARLVGQAGGDATGPALIVCLSEQGVELGISHRGQPVLDYRPAGMNVRENVVSIVAGHMSRLKRYCQRYVPFAEGQLETVYLCGDARAVDEVLPAFQSELSLTVKRLEAPALDVSWSVEGQAAGCELGAALGACLLEEVTDPEQMGPNLLERLKSQAREPMAPAVVRTLLPLAAAVLVSLAAWGAVLHEKRGCQELDRQMSELAPLQEEALAARRNVLRDEAKAAHLRAIQAAASQPAWNELTERVATCLPDDVWLDNLAIDAEGKVVLSGVAFTDDGVFEFVQWLRDCPGFSRVSLGGTQTARLPTGPATRFDVLADFAAEGKQEGEGNGSG